MARRLANFVVLLSLLLALASAFMWLRSYVIFEAWEFQPRPSAVAAPPRTREAREFMAPSGWTSYPQVESAKGRLAWVEYDLSLRTPPQFGGYRVVADPFTPGRWSREPRRRSIIPNGTVHRRIPGVAEWYFIPPFSYTGRQRHVAVSWPVFVAAGLILPSAVAWRRRRRRRSLAAPAFPVQLTTGSAAA